MHGVKGVGEGGLKGGGERRSMRNVRMFKGSRPTRPLTHVAISFPEKEGFSQLQIHHCHKSRMMFSQPKLKQRVRSATSGDKHFRTMDTKGTF